MGHFSSQEKKPAEDGDKGKLQLLLADFFYIFFVDLYQLIIFNYYPLVEILTCLTSALVFVFRITQTGGEEKPTGQTDPEPRSGQAPKNEEEEGLPGKVRGHIIIYIVNIYFFILLLSLFFTVCFHLFHCQLLRPWFCCIHQALLCSYLDNYQTEDFILFSPCCVFF